MANIQFEEEQQYQQQCQTGEQKPFFTRLVLATGIVSDDKHAQYVLLGVAVLILILAFMIPSFTGSGARAPTNQDIERIIQLQQGVTH